ncbi:MAG: ATP-binding protein, partial [Anaerolineae bacterium]|nr:ATP-binding protein [Anaerolineae bacterium]
LPDVMADPDRVGQIVRNLVSNGVRHAARGGVVAISARDTLADQKRSVRVEVSDDGPGIPPDQIAHVFDRFWRGDQSRARDTGGSGLGLAITRYLVEAHGGQIGVESDGLSGTVFWFTIPVTDGVTGGVKAASNR